MILQIVHTTHYEYECPVVLEAQYLKFKPLRRPYITPLDFELKIDPHPVKTTERLDAENNYFHQVWPTSETTQHFNIEAVIRLETEPFNPFDFLIDPNITPSQYDFYYSEKHSDYLAPYLECEAFEGLKDFTRQTIEDSDDKMVPFLSLLAQKVYDNWEHEKRDEEHPLDPDQCFQQKKGSCKDLAWMLMMMLRGQGIASRFVSGYSFNPELDQGHELHAWIEVLLPGAGWVGIDPSSGLLANEYYVPVATSFDPALTMPVEGTFRGSCESSFDADVKIILHK